MELRRTTAVNDQASAFRCELWRRKCVWKAAFAPPGGSRVPRIPPMNPSGYKPKERNFKVGARDEPSVCNISRLPTDATPTTGQQRGGELQRSRLRASVGSYLVSANRNAITPTASTRLSATSAQLAATYFFFPLFVTAVTFSLSFRPNRKGNRKLEWN